MSCKGDYNKVKNDTTSVYVLNPGLYCDGLEIKQGTVELRSGIHVFKDYGLDIAAQGTLRVEAGGSVTILFTGGPDTGFRNAAALPSTHTARLCLRATSSDRPISGVIAPRISGMPARDRSPIHGQ